MCRYHLFIVSIVGKGELIIISFCFEHQNAVTQIFSKAWCEQFDVGTIFFSEHFVLCQILILPLC